MTSMSLLSTAFHAFYAFDVAMLVKKLEKLEKLEKLAFCASSTVCFSTVLRKSLLKGTTSVTRRKKEQRERKRKEKLNGKQRAKKGLGNWEIQKLENSEMGDLKFRNQK